MLIFKYNSPSPLALSMLRRAEIYFATPSELNDPTECRSDYRIDGPIEVWERFVDSVFRRCIYHCDISDSLEKEKVTLLLESTETIAKAMRKVVKGKSMPWINVYQEFSTALKHILCKKLLDAEIDLVLRMTKWVICDFFTNKLKDEKCIVSFSQSATNPTMWSHYAAAQTGFCVIYKISDSKLPVESDVNILSDARLKEDRYGQIYELGCYKDKDISVLPVKYRKSPPKSNAFRHLARHFDYTDSESHYDVPEHFGDSGESFQVDDIGLVKSTDWKYEREVRAFFPSPKTPNTAARVVSVKKDNILGVILAPKASTELVSKVATSLFIMWEANDKTKTNSLYIFQAKESFGKYELDIVVKGMAGGFLTWGEIPFVPVERFDANQLDEANALAEEIMKSSKA